jgi:hypothetical protein
VHGPIAQVEIRLDGAPVASLDSPPWTREVDFGPGLYPHELLALAVDERGNELARARQWINMPRAPAEAEILLEHDREGRAVSARIAWQSVMGEEPARVSVSFDGRPLELDAARRVTLPAHAADVTHVVTVELEFESGVHSRDDVAFGGAAGDRAQSELTAVAIRTRKKRNRVDPAAMRGLLRSDAGPLRVAAAERGGASIWVVRDDNAGETFSRLKDASLFGGGFSPSALALQKTDAVQFVWPRARAFGAAGVPTALFPSSEGFSRADGGFAFLLSHVANPAPAGIFPRYADAVAVAGVNAFASFARRAVVLVLGKDAQDASTHRAQLVRRYLEALRVPLFVWTLDRSVASSAWGEVASIATRGQLRAAYDRLRESLDAQALVWVEGRLLPQQVALEPAAAAAGVELLR